jgi:hypothetical protein
MRIVALAAEHTPELTIATVPVILVGGLLGMPPGVLFAFLRSRLPGRPVLQGAVHGLALLVLVGFPALLREDDAELAIGPPWLGRTLFALLLPAYGLLLAALEPRLERRARDLRPGWVAACGLVAAALLIPAVALFAQFTATAVFRIGH